MERTAEDPTVIVGLACRVPGADSPEQLWENILQQRDLRRKMPADRFTVENFYHEDGTHKGTTNAQYGYFLDQDLGHFDASFFGISGKEAEAIDPQQRLILEVVYEALESAGITLQDIDGSQTSVFCGSFTNDYNAMLSKDLETYPKYTVTGTGNAILSNRISYFFNLHGTSVTVDTACSSSLVGLHLANKLIRSGESDMSIVVGSSLHFDPNMFITMTDLGMLSTDGRCRAFDAAGSGYVRGEGVCVAILKRQSSALRDGDTIRAVVRASGSNHDGSKQGITLPNSTAQEALIRSTYQNAGLNPADTQYFEAHGTGTQAGDPNETRAIGAIFSSNETPLLIGSVKTNIGHLEGASGIAAIIKTTLALEKGKIPPNMHFHTPNPKIDFEGWNLEVPQTLLEWPRPTEGVRRASVNSFGYGGTNAHVVIEEFSLRSVINEPKVEVKAIANGVRERPYLLPLTSHSKSAGELLEAKLADYIRTTGPNIADLAYSLTNRRTMNKYRSFAVASNTVHFLENLQNPRPSAPWSLVTSKTPRLGFVFTGQGAQWYAMGRQLIQEFLQSLPDAPDWRVTEELLRSKGDSRLDQTLYSQTICTALQLALIDLLESWRIKPTAVVGHSSGEVAAAYSAGILSFENAMIAAYYRGLYMSSGKDSNVRGGMMAVGLPEHEALETLKDFSGRLTLAAVNSPTTVTISGDEDAIISLKSVLDGKGVFARQLKVAQAFHSHHMYPLAPAYRTALNSSPGFAPQAPSCRMVSSVTSRLANSDEMVADYWADNMTNVVRFSDALTGIIFDEYDQQAVDILVEIGPHPALKGPCKQTVQSLKLEPIPYIATLTRDIPDFEGLLTMAGQLFTHGYPLDITAVGQNISRGHNGELVKLDPGAKLPDFPSYAWDHKRYWSETRVIREHRLRRFRHSILGHIIPGSIPSRPKWRNFLRLSEQRWLSEHCIDGKAVFPGSGYVSMAVEAVIRLKDQSINSISLREIVIKAPLMIPVEDDGVEVVLEIHPASLSARRSSDHWHKFTVFSFPDKDTCVEHCHGLISVQSGAPAGLDSTVVEKDLDRILNESNRSLSASSFYRRLSQIGLEYGPSFRLLNGSLENGNGSAVSAMLFDSSMLSTEPADVTVIHPTLLDSCFHIVFSAIESRTGKQLEGPYVPSFIEALDLSGLLTNTPSSHLHQYRVGSTTKLMSPVATNSDIMFQNSSGITLMTIRGLELKSLGRETSESEAGRTLFYKQKWLPCFDLLPSRKDLSDHSLEHVIDIFAHQHPDCTILFFSSSTDRLRDTIRTLGLGQSQRHKCHRLDVAIGQVDDNLVGELQEIAEQSRGLVRICEPSNTYDLIIIDRDPIIDIMPYLAEKGYVMLDHQLGIQVSSDLAEVSSDPKLNTYKRAKDEGLSSIKDLTVVAPNSPSDRVQSIWQSLQSMYPSAGKVTPEAVMENHAAGELDSLVILSCLDSSPRNEETFRFIQHVLTGSAMKKIFWVLQGATMESSSPEQALILGLIRTAKSENDQLDVAVIDVGVESPASTVASVIKCICGSNIHEDELAERDGCIYMPRIEADDVLNRKLPNGPHRDPKTERFDTYRSLALTIGQAGFIDSLHFEEDDQSVSEPLASDEIEIEVKASSITARDLDVVMGATDGLQLGDECAGVVTRVGSGVDEFSVNDSVIAFRPGQGAHKTLVRNPASLSYKLTGPMPLTDAAAIPVAVTTAHYALNYVANLKPEETVLIHSAAGAVGQIAIQIAQHKGAIVLATSSIESERDFLQRRYHLPHRQVFNSIDDQFVKGVMDFTHGRGVDVVLNTLSGPLLRASWSCIGAFGRFIELSHSDIKEKARLTMDGFGKNVVFAAVDMVNMFEENRLLAARVFRESCQLVQTGEILCEKSSVLPYSRVAEAFQLARREDQIGRVVLVATKDDMVPISPPTYRSRQIFDSTKTYLLVGGLGGIGSVLSQWMVRMGAKKLAFLSRSGANSPKASETVNWLKQRNIQVDVYVGDVAELKDVRACTDAIGEGLSGVFHAAMVTRDSTLDTMTYSQWQQCLLPKVQGVENLHAATLERRLDFFVCFSSVTAIIGSKGLANYSAANLYLDSFMRHRREMGLCGTTMDVGAVSDIGVLAENDASQSAMERLGMDFISEQELLYQLEEAVKADLEVPSSAHNYQTITGISLHTPDVYWSSKSIFKNLYANHDFGISQEDVAERSLFAVMSIESDEKVRLNLLVDALMEKTAQIMGISRDAMAPSNSLSSYGLDSLMAADFRRWFRKEAHVDVALFDILSPQPISVLTAKAAKSFAENLAASQASAESIPAPSKPVSEPSQVGLTPKRQGGIVKRPEMRDVPVSAYQSRLWFLHSILDDKSTLNLPIVVRIKGKPKKDVFQRAIAELGVRNPSLRTSYFEGKYMTQQLPLDDVELEVNFRDFSGEQDPEDALNRYVAHSKAIELDIESGEVMTWCLVKLADEQFALVSIMHHIAVDRGCYGLLMNQIALLYDAIDSGKNLTSVPKPTFSYVDFTIWHNTYLQSDEMKAHRDWWRANLDSAPVASSLLPFARSKRTPQGDASRASVRTTLDARLFSRMKRLAAQIQGSPYHFLLTAFRAFLYRYTEDRDLVILAVDGSRPHSDADDIVGFFVNLCPVRCQDDCETTFAKLFLATKARALDAMAHSSVPFDTIVDIAQVQRTASHFPIGQVVVNYQIHGAPAQYPTRDFVMGDASMTDIPTACDLGLEALETSDHKLDLRLEYSTALYGDGDMERFIDNFQVFLANAIKDHHQPIEEIGMCGQLEMNVQSQQYWNTATTRPLWKDHSVVQRIFEASRMHPEARAITTSDGDTMTYERLTQNAELVGSALVTAGVACRSRVALLALPGVSAVTGMLGVLLARSCYVPLDLDFARDRLAFMIQDAGCEVMLVGPGAEPLAKELVSELKSSICIININDTINSSTHPVSFDPRQDEDPFYMIYTSVSPPQKSSIGNCLTPPQGSTGTPKGVVLTEANTRQMLSTLQKDYMFSNNDKFLHQSSIAFDLSIVQIFSALASGGETCIASSETRKDPHSLAEFMQRESVTVTYFTPTQYALLLESNTAALRACHNYRVAYFAGERLPVRVAKAFYELGTPATLYNTWSPSELVVQTTIAKILKPTDDATSLPIGYPLDNCRHYILDAHLLPVPVGFVGEIVVGGAQVGMGYLNRPLENSKSFLEDPFCSTEDRRVGWTRMFRTGDKGRFLPDGQLEFHGRIAGDKQIKLRGFRIDLGEVEQVIFQTSQNLKQGLTDIAVIARPRENQPDDIQLVAFLVPPTKLDGPEQKVLVTDIHHAISTRLNHYMLPNGYQFLDRLPTTIGGKVDLKDLRRRQLDLLQPSNNTEGNGTPENVNSLQKSVLGVFQDVLGSSTYVNLADSFFEKGGNSILLVRLQSKIRQLFDVTLVLSELFKEPTAQAVCTFIEKARGHVPINGLYGSGKVNDWAAETRLPRDSRYVPSYGLKPASRESVQEILLAGPMTLISTHLMASLLRVRGDVRLHILGMTQIASSSDVIEELHKYNAIDLQEKADIKNRIVAVNGTLLEPNFGLSKADFRKLGRTVQTIYFLGGEVSLLQTYSHLKVSNVQPIFELINLAGMGDCLSELHYLSTWSVAHLQTWPNPQRSEEIEIVTAEEKLTHFQPSTEDDLGYFKARWVAENLFFQAASRGFPVTVTRASAVGSLAATAAQSTNPSLDDFAIRMILGMIETGAVPQMGSPTNPPFSVDIIPVKYLAAALTALTIHSGRDEGSQNEAQIYHLGNPRPMKLTDLLGTIEKLRPDSARAAVVPIEEWLQMMDGASGVEDAAATMVRTTVLREYFSQGQSMFSLDQSRSSSLLKEVAPQLEETCPHMDGKFLDALWAIAKK
ncbi:polyketide synthase [Astrocystis sublimbata]|nr:polyketide synthase [Astrocystis sublimbata]